MAKKEKGRKKAANAQAGGSNEELLDRLNAALSMEYAACIQYLQQQSLVKGQDRHDFAPFFAASSEEAHLHARNLGNKIVSLGGIPTVEPARVRQATGLREMLLNDLEMERSALDAYIRSWEAAEENLTLRLWLEEIIRQEQLHVEELEKLTARQGAG